MIDDYVLYLKTEKKLGSNSISNYVLDLENFKDFLNAFEHVPSFGV